MAMLPPWLHLVTGQPALLAEHAEAYAELVAAEASALSAFWRRQAVLGLLALCSAAVAAVLAGVAALLWAAIPLAQWRAPGLLWVVPLLPLAVAVVCVLLARRGVPAPPFGSLRQQVRADWSLLREAASP